MQLDNAKVPSEDHFVNAQEDNESQWNLYYPATMSLCTFTTQSFSKWRNSYYQNILVPLKTCTDRMTSDFVVQNDEDPASKSKGEHV